MAMKLRFNFKKNILLNLLIPLLITILILFIFFKDISLADIKLAILNIPLLFLGIFILLSLAGTLLRTLRYRVLVSGKIGFWAMFMITLVRNFSVDLLPARSAALAFYSYLTVKKGLSLAEGASSFVIAVFYDVLALSVMLGSMSVFITSELNRTTVLLALLVLFCLAVGFLFLGERILRLVLKLQFLKKVPSLRQFIQDIYHYLSEHQKPGERLKVFFLSLVIRIIKYMTNYILFAGVVGSVISLQHFSLFSFGLAGTEISSLLPIQGLGGFGTWELAFAFIFKLLSIPAENPYLTGLVLHVITQVWEYSIGISVFLFLVIRNRTKSP